MLTAVSFRHNASMQRLGCVGTVFGLVFAGAGIFIILGSILAPDRVRFSSESGVQSPAWLGAIFGACFLVVGLFVYRLRKEMDERLARSWMAAIAFIVGLAVLAAALGDSDDSSFPAGRWAAMIGGVIFMLAGFLIMATQSRSHAIRQTLASFVALILITLFGVLTTGIAIAPPASGSGQMMVFGYTVPSPAWIDRIFLSICALILDYIAIFGWYNLLRKKYARGKPGDV